MHQHIHWVLASHYTVPLTKRHLVSVALQAVQHRNPLLGMLSVIDQCICRQDQALHSALCLLLKMEEGTACGFRGLCLKA